MEVLILRNKNISFIRDRPALWLEGTDQRDQEEIHDLRETIVLTILYVTHVTDILCATRLNVDSILMNGGLIGEIAYGCRAHAY